MKKIYTFYSYKGGVGRSMALANVAEWLYQQHKSVLMIDWDLEAPGLEGYFAKDYIDERSKYIKENPDVNKLREEYLEQVKSKPGLMDILIDYKRRYDKFKKETVRAAQELDMFSRKLAELILNDETNWNLIKKNLSLYAVFNKEEIKTVIQKFKEINQSEKINISHVAKIIYSVIDDEELAERFSINISDKLRDGKLDLEEIEIYLSVYALLTKDEVEKVIEEIKKTKAGSELNNASFLSIINKYFSPEKLQVNTENFLNGLGELKDYFIPMHALTTQQSNGLWLLSAGKRNVENFTAYSKYVQDFNWSDFYTSYNGEKYFEWFRKKIEGFADVILIDSRTGVSEMSGVSTRHLADVIVIVTAPNPQNLSGMATMVKSFIHEDVKNARKRLSLNDLKIIVVPSRIDVNEIELRNKFQAKFYRTVDEVLGNNLSKDFWELGIPYIPNNNYVEELAVGLSNAADDLEQLSQSIELDRAYRKLVTYMLEGKFLVHETVNENLFMPYIGLTSFQTPDASLFFGRSQEVIRMLDILSLRNLLVITGAPGSGKSSSINAGLIPALKDNTIKKYAAANIILFQIDAHPFLCLSKAMVNNSNNIDSEKIIKILTNSFLAKPDAFTENIQLAGISNNENKYLIIIDEFENIFVSADEGERQKFINAITTWISQQEVSVILSIRSDYYGELLSDKTFSTVAEQATIHLSVPGEKELKRIITEPAAKANLKIEESLTERIIKDIEKENFKLPVLQAVLQKLWDNRSDNTLTHVAYDRFGRAEGIAKKIYEGMYSQFTAAQYDAAMPLITNLVNVLNRSRKKLPLSGIDTAKKITLKPFIDKGLLAINSDGDNKETIELANEVLITEWPQLRDYIAKDHEFLAWKQQLNIKLDFWVNHDKQSEFLLRKTELAEAKEWLQKREQGLSNSEKDFINKSNAHLKTQKEKRLGYIITGIVVLVILGYNIFFSNKTSQQNNQVANSLDSAKAYVDFTAMYNKASNQYDLDFNLSTLKKYYLLDKRYQDTLQDIKAQIENTISYKFHDTLYSFYSDLRSNPGNIKNVSDTLNWAGKQYNSNKNFLSWLNRLSTYKFKNSVTDSTFLLSSDSSGFIATYIETGNVILDNNLKEYKSFRSLDTMRFDYNFKIRSFSYRIIDSIPRIPTVEVFVCASRDNNIYRTVNNIVNALKAENKYTVLVRNNFVPSQDNSSPYYITSNQIRYNGTEELKIAQGIQSIINKYQISTILTPTRKSSGNYLSVFICGGTDSKMQTKSY